MSIVSVAEFVAYFRSEIQGDETFFQACLDAADEGVQDLCQRKFVVAAAASARSYVPKPCHDVLRIHDCTSVTTVVENGVTLTAGVDFQAETAEGPQTTSWSGVVMPYEQLRKFSGTWYTDQHKATVVATAAWGWAAIPESIKMACRVGAKDLADARDVKLGIAAVNDFGPLRVRENPAVQLRAEKFMRTEAFGIG